MGSYQSMDESEDSDKEYDLDCICSSKQISYFKKVKNEDPAVSIHCAKYNSVA